ncbi:5-formyltetrahydrofolate cyclo-ligase [[Acholeplasma] multilocale]|uniref:5-formyltetrahydrofolate cyclo-ligase n=1 Tax=[Acholeplasma] multilocale TaxID=264638 RepID=UPI000683D815|nr:5-formyltetrahydrofolate cyclo-ligase [[Acholeplasma] multilocale]
MTNKPEIRDSYLKVRSMLSQSYLEECNKMIARKVIFFIKRYNLKKIGIFISTNHEPETRDIIRHCIENGVEVYAPNCLRDTNEMDFRRILDIDKDVTFNTELNVYETNDQAEKLRRATDLDALFMPLVAFDSKLARVGMGKSFYDSWIDNTNYQGYKIGLSQSTQLTSEDIITEEHDQNMNFVITEKEVYVPMIEETEEEEFDYDVTYWRLNDETLEEE